MSKLVALTLISAAGTLLLPLFGLVFRFEPTYVRGLKADAKRAEINCYLAAGCYAGVLILLILIKGVRRCIIKSQPEAAELTIDSDREIKERIRREMQQTKGLDESREAVAV